jgi:hypothetical protein
LLFVIVIEALSKLSTTVDGGFLSGFSMGTRNYDVIHISHLLSTDDALLFCEANPEHLRFLCTLFLCFAAVSNLKINLTMSKLVHVGNVNNVDCLANFLGCTMSSLSMKYLDLILRAPFKARAIWDCVIEKVEHRLDE